MAAAALPLGTAWRWYTRLSAPLRILPWLLSLMLLFSICRMILTPPDCGNFPLLHVYTLLEAGLVLLYFRRVLSGFLPDSVLWISFLLFNALTLVHAVYQPHNNRPDMLPRCVEGIGIILLCAASYYRILKQLRIKKIYRDPVFLVNIGLLLYFSEPLFQLIIHPYMAALRIRISTPEWTLHNLYCLVLYLFVFAGLLQNRRSFS